MYKKRNRSYRYLGVVHHHTYGAVSYSSLTSIYILDASKEDKGVGLVITSYYFSDTTAMWRTGRNGVSNNTRMPSLL